MHERRVSTLPHTLEQFEKTTQKNIPPAQWKISYSFGDSKLYTPFSFVGKGCVQHVATVYHIYAIPLGHAGHLFGGSKPDCAKTLR